MIRVALEMGSHQNKSLNFSSNFTQSRDPQREPKTNRNGKSALSIRFARIIWEPAFDSFQTKQALHYFQ